ncbi:FtsX-like permease family protein [Streptomyces cellulosae]
MLVTVLVGYAVLAAANTLVMAALARTRELSLLRLVGVTRAQVKRMIHAEQAGLLGVALLIGAAIAAVTLTTIVRAVTGAAVPHVPVVGWAVLLGGTAALALLATVVPVGRVLRTAPVEGMGVRE